MILSVHNQFLWESSSLALSRSLFHATASLLQQCFHAPGRYQSAWLGMTPSGHFEFLPHVNQLSKSCFESKRKCCWPTSCDWQLNAICVFLVNGIYVTKTGVVEISRELQPKISSIVYGNSKPLINFSRARSEGALEKFQIRNNSSTLQIVFSADINAWMTKKAKLSPGVLKYENTFITLCNGNVFDKLNKMRKTVHLTGWNITPVRLTLYSCQPSKTDWRVIEYAVPQASKSYPYVPFYLHQRPSRHVHRFQIILLQMIQLSATSRRRTQRSMILGKSQEVVIECLWKNETKCGYSELKNDGGNHNKVLERNICK